MTADSHSSLGNRVFSPGRHADPNKVSAVFEAANRLFSRRGFNGASMDAIAAEADVSKPTLYRYFNDKESLFFATLQMLLEQLPSPEALVLERHGPLRNRLTGIAHDALRLGTGPLMASLHSMLSLPLEFASYRANDLWDANFRPYHDAMQLLLQAERDAGVLDVPDVARAACHFFSLIAGEPMMRIFLAGEAPIREREAQAHIHAAVEVFLRAYRRM